MSQKMILMGRDGSRTEFEMRQDYINVSDMGGVERDPPWSFRDAAGHVHTDAEPSATLKRVYDDDETYWCHDCHDDHEGDYHLECVHCGETVKPGTRFRAAGTRMTPGMSECYINGEYVPEDEFKRRYAAALAEADL